MIEKTGLDFEVTCDFCSDFEDTEEPEFMSAIDKIKRLGWRVFKKDGEWWHKCPSCQSNSRGADFDVVT